ncbi:MAG: hypothetical protein JNK48_11660 [Bryobacterales bacterium]|nr:hypothetical protein [Bryobacterales bacterium]
MAYKQDLQSAARRHLNAAQLLYEQEEPGSRPGCMAVAGYLFGLAGELAVKQMMRACGLKPAIDGRDDPYYAHFPELKNMLALAQGRRAGELHRLAQDPRLFQHWSIRMRYAPTSDIQTKWVDAWKNSAEELVNRMADP